MKRIVAGNWKMHGGMAATTEFFREFAERLPEVPEGVELLLFPPALSFAAAAEGARRGGERVGLGVQNIHWEDSGAFTGELSAAMAREAGATHVLVGHSERRHLFGESEMESARKAAAALKEGIVPILCVGETLAERREGRLESVLLGQLDAALDLLDEESGAAMRVAYEPVWAIGTGETATPEDASTAHRILRSRLAERWMGTGRSIPILYGGSVRPENAAELVQAPDVDGLLVGGASLDPDSFARIAEAVASA